jgi:hypothetical protein
MDVEAGPGWRFSCPRNTCPGAEAEVDFGEVWVVLNGVKTKCHVFVFRLSHSGKPSTGSIRRRPRKLSWRATWKAYLFGFGVCLCAIR